MRTLALTLTGEKGLAQGHKLIAGSWAPLRPCSLVPELGCSMEHPRARLALCLGTWEHKGTQERSRGQQGGDWVKPHGRAETLPPLAGPQSLGTKGPGPSQHFCEGLSSLGWEPQSKEGLYRSPSDTGPSVINPEMPLCDETRGCPGQRQGWEAQPQDLLAPAPLRGSLESLRPS